jgi:hypothetical protein
MKKSTKRLNKHSWLHYLATIFEYLIRGTIGVAEWILIGAAGIAILQTKTPPYDLAIGLPLTIISIGFVLNALWTTILTCISLRYNRSVCRWCR